MLTAREAIALGERALFTISTRYHPVVFGPMRGTLAMALVTSYYSSVRMRGALANVGLTDLAIYPETWLGGDLTEVTSEVVERRSEISHHMGEVRQVRIAEQNAWWDAIVEGMRSGNWPGRPDLTPVPRFTFDGTWAQVNQSSRRSADLLGQQVVLRGRADKRASDLQARVEKLEGQAVVAERENRVREREQPGSYVNRACARAGSVLKNLSGRASRSDAVSELRARLKALLTLS